MGAAVQTLSPTKEVGLSSFWRLFLPRRALFLALLGTQQVLAGLLVFQCHWRVSLPDGLPCGSAGKESARNAGDLGSISGLGRSPGEGIGCPLHSWASLVAQTVKNPPAMQETWVRSLVWEDPLEEGMTIHSSTLMWRIRMDRGA